MEQMIIILVKIGGSFRRISRIFVASGSFQFSTVIRLKSVDSATVQQQPAEMAEWLDVDRMAVLLSKIVAK